MRRWLALLLLFIFPFQSFSAQAQLPSAALPAAIYAAASTDAPADTAQHLLQQDLNEFLDHCEAPLGVSLQHNRPVLQQPLCLYLSQVMPYQLLPERRPPKEGYSLRNM